MVETSLGGDGLSSSNEALAWRLSTESGRAQRRDDEISVQYRPQQAQNPINL